MGSRRKFTKEFKQSVVQESYSRPVAKICREHDIHLNMLHRWKKEYELDCTPIFAVVDKKLPSPI